MPMSPMYIWGPAESLSRSLRTCLEAELSGAHFFGRQMKGRGG
jgi:hypothetical protein